MHAGKVKNASDQRAHEDIFHAANFETILPAEIQNEKCTPAWLRTTPASGHTEANTRRHSRNDLAGGDTKRKMHASEMKNATSQRAHEDLFSAATGETTEPAEIQNEKCTPAR